MELKELKEDVVQQTIKYNGKDIQIGLLPYSFTNEDNGLTIAAYVVKGLKSWDLTLDGEPLEISVESLTEVIPDGVLTLIFDALRHLQSSAVGKLKSRS